MTPSKQELRELDEFVKLERLNVYKIWIQMKRSGEIK